MGGRFKNNAIMRYYASIAAESAGWNVGRGRLLAVMARKRRAFQPRKMQGGISHRGGFRMLYTWYSYGCLVNMRALAYPPHQHYIIPSLQH